MRKRHPLFRFPFLLGWMLLTVGWGMFVPHTEAFAASPALPPGYSLTLTESTSTITYGDPSPSFQAQLTVPAGENPLKSPNHFFFTFSDSGSIAYAPDGSGGSGSTYTFSWKGTTAGGPFLPVGQHSVVANYFSSVLNQSLQSALVTFIVQKYTPSISCSVTAPGPITTTNAVLNFMVSTQSGPSVDWSNATVSITFFGPQTSTESNLTVSGMGTGTTGTVNAPPVGGTYSYQCSFSGTHNFTPAQSAVSAPNLIVSLGRQIGGITLYSTPTTITAGHIVTIEIVVSRGPGLPTPTGVVGLFLGPNTTTNPFALSGGQVTVQVQFPSPLPGTTVGVDYSGDAVYASSVAHFPLTNPPIPTGSNPTPNPTTAPISTTPSAPTPSGSSTSASSSTPASSSTTRANGGTTAGSHPPAAPSTQGPLLFGIVVVVLLLLAAGGSGVFLVLRKRARGAAPAATLILPSSEEG